MSTGICSLVVAVVLVAGDSSVWAITLRVSYTLRLWQCSDDFVHVTGQFIEESFAEGLVPFPFGLVSL